MMNPLHYIPIWIASWVWPGGGPATLAEAPWEPCYRQAYLANHPGQHRVANPVEALEGVLIVRPEVWGCREELLAWLNDPGRPAASRLQRQQLVELRFVLQQSEADLLVAQTRWWRRSPWRALFQARAASPRLD